MDSIFVRNLYFMHKNSFGQKLLPGWKTCMALSGVRGGRESTVSWQLQRADLCGPQRLGCIKPLGCDKHSPRRRRAPDIWAFCSAGRQDS